MQAKYKQVSRAFYLRSTLKCQEIWKWLSISVAGREDRLTDQWEPLPDL